MKISFITTVLNEEKTIEALLVSLVQQTTLPMEAIIVDGGSTDKTVAIISKFKLQISKLKKRVKITFVKKKGNRAVGRNLAISKAKGDIIVCSDAGCILDKRWIEEITRPFLRKDTQVVAGYYKAKAKTLFQKCLVPYVLVMKDKVNPKTFLPASRSMSFRKSVWKKLGGFPERYSHNEDYVFSRKIQTEKIPIAFAKKAIVYWIPRKTVKEAFIMFWRFAYGDAEASIYRPKVMLVFLRYTLLFLFIVFSIITMGTFSYWLSVILIILYIIWSIYKNFRYVKLYEALLILPLIQLVADSAVITGTIFGTFYRWNIRNKS